MRSSIASSARRLSGWCCSSLPPMGRAPVARSIVGGNAQLLRSLPHFVAVHAARERLVLELLLYRRDLEIAEAPGRPHQRARDQEAAQLVHREQRPRERRVARDARIAR